MWITYIVKKILVNITLAKLGGAIITAILISSIKYSLSGELNIHLENYLENVSFALLAWFIKTIFTDFLSDYFKLKGVNLSLQNILYGEETLKMGDNTLLSQSKPKLYCAMESYEDLGSKSPKPLDKGKGIDLKDNTNYTGESSHNSGVSDNDTKPLNKGKGIDRSTHPWYDAFKNKTNDGFKNPGNDGSQVGSDQKKPFAIWSQLNPGLDPQEAFFPKRVNPGPGFNVPGGVVPIRDDICKHIDYNSHILNQFKNMDLATAIRQRDNYGKYIEAINAKLDHATKTLAKIPETPTTEYEYRLKAQILSDLEKWNNDIIRSQARATLLNSRVEFIQIEIGKEESNNKS
jgi:hypothetical protein